MFPRRLLLCILALILSFSFGLGLDPDMNVLGFSLDLEKSSPGLDKGGFDQSSS